MTGLLAALAGANIIYGVGMLETGLTYSPAQLVIDNEIYVMIKRIMRGIPVNDLTLDLDTIHKVGPGGSFLTAKTTVKNMRGLHSVGGLLDRRNRGNWRAAGGQDMEERARERALKILKEHRPSVALPEGTKSDLRRLVEEAEAEFRDLKLMK